MQRSARTQVTPAHPAPLRACAALVALFSCAGLGALAEPLPPVRAPLPHALPRQAPAVATGASPLDRACATDIDLLGQAYSAFAEHVAGGSAALPTPNSTDAGEIAVLEDDGTFFFTDKNGNVNLDVAAAARAFYRTHGDDYDELALWLSTGMTHWLGSPSALAAAWLTQNAIAGIGLGNFDFNTALGLPARLQTVLTMNGLQRYPDDPGADVAGLPHYVTQDVLAHEFGHRWLAYPLVEESTGPVPALLGRANQHWSFFFDADGSVMEGPDWLEVAPQSFLGLEPIARFGMLDQYLMGVRDRAEVESLTVLSDTATFTPPGPYVPFTDPLPGMTAAGPARRFDITDVEAANSPRVPAAATAPHHVRVAFALITPRGSAASAADLAKLETIRAAFPGTVAGYTGGRMTLDASLDSRAGKPRLEHERLADTENFGAPRAVALRATVEQAGIPIAVRPDGVALHWRTDPGAPWSTLPMSPAASDTFVAMLPGSSAGTRLEYWFRAESDSAGLYTDLPDLASSLPFAYVTGTDATAPRVTHWAAHEQSSAQLPCALLARVTDNLGVDSVWCEFSANGGPLVTQAAAPAGRDSFVVTLGAGLPSGALLAYRFVARDASTAGNLGYSNPAFDTLRVGHDRVDEFWNPAPWIHGIVRFNRRDEWHLVAGPSSPSGSTAWHCGLDSLPYGPYQDAALTSPLVYDIAAGCSLAFVHRYSLEAASATQAYDGARVEVQVANGTWLPATPATDYSHTMASADQGLPQGAPCWSGEQDTWRAEHFDLSTFAPGPVRVRFRMSTDLFVGAGGWWIDQVRFRFPGPPLAGVADAGWGDVRLGAMWPNPARGPLHQAIRLARSSNVEWTVHDVAGRSVATLWRGTLPAGAHELSGVLPRALAGGLYFASVRVDARTLTTRRLAVVR